MGWGTNRENQAKGIRVDLLHHLVEPGTGLFYPIPVVGPLVSSCFLKEHG